MSNWFEPESKTGWKKKDSREKRRRNVFKSTSKRLSKYKRLIQAGRKLLSLANVTRDEETYQKAKLDSEYFFNEARRIKNVKR